MPTSDLWRAVVYVQNYREPGVPHDMPVFFGRHTWSLAVEEQFYLLWPLLVWWLTPRGVLRASIVLVLAALAFRLVAFELSRDPSLWILYGWLPSNVVAELSWRLLERRLLAKALGADLRDVVTCHELTGAHGARERT
ncbi:MAG TPA: hypothetical protein VK427_07580, partial [Kofleriaceae bacterium]|nr:hypothetical protein [Kofleriaceae bacterium]